MVCIDPLPRFRVIPDVRVPAFMADYESVNALHDMSKKHPGVCLDVIHHTRKAKSDDPIDDVSGTYGLTAACDSVTVLRHSSDGAVMHVAGRMWMRDDNQYTMRRAGNQRWEMLGVHLDITDEQRETLTLVKAAGTAGMSGRELGEKLGITQPSPLSKLPRFI